jgi:hypothetical protein
MNSERGIIIEGIRGWAAESNEQFRNSSSPVEKLTAIQNALGLVLQTLRAVPDLPVEYAALDELLIALQRMSTRPSDIADEFLKRDATNKDLLPAQELKAHILVGYSVLSSAKGISGKAQARTETAKAYKAFGARSAASISRWLTVINDDPAYGLYQQLREIAERRGWLGLPIIQARQVIKDHVAELHSIL